MRYRRTRFQMESGYWTEWMNDDDASSWLKGKNILVVHVMEEMTKTEYEELISESERDDTFDNHPLET